MGVVYRAHDPQLERDVAIKLISVAMAAGHHDLKETSSRFAREARVAARLQHPNVVAIYDAGEFGDQLFLVMELVEGETLAHRLARGQFPAAEEALGIVAQAADALAAAHQAGVIHRDMKPGNLLITRRGQVKVGDFGIARAIGETTELTRTGMMVGSPAYMAPEQVQGRTLDGRADLFSLGVVLYEMLLRRKPFPADTLTTLVYQILHEDPFDDVAATQELRPEIAEFLKWTLAKDPAHRVPDAVTFAIRARAIAAGLSGSATAPTSRLPVVPVPAAAPQGGRLPPPSYATSAPTAIVERRRGGALRFLPFVAGGLVLAALAAALVFRWPAPPPDTSKGAIPLNTATAQPLRVEPLAAPPPEPAKKEPEKEPAAKPPAAAPPPSTAAAALKPAEIAPAPAAAIATPGIVVEPAPAPEAPVEAAVVGKTFECRRGAEFHVDPEEVQVAIDGRAIGTADEWDGAGGGKSYIFPGPGDYTVRLSLAGYRTQWVRVRVTPSAKRDIAKVDNELEESE
jgi:serine/threonine-protein kinase